MAKTKEEAQDSAMRNMDKINRRNKDVYREPTLAEQIKARERYESLSMEEKRAMLSEAEWSNLLADFMSKKRVGSHSVIRGIISKNWKSKFAAWHQSGQDFFELVPYFEEKVRDIF